MIVSFDVAFYDLCFYITTPFYLFFHAILCLYDCFRVYFCFSLSLRSRFMHISFPGFMRVELLSVCRFFLLGCFLLCHSWRNLLSGSIIDEASVSLLAKPVFPCDYSRFPSKLGFVCVSYKGVFFVLIFPFRKLLVVDLK